MIVIVYLIRNRTLRQAMKDLLARRGTNQINNSSIRIVVQSAQFSNNV